MHIKINLSWGLELSVDKALFFVCCALIAISIVFSFSLSAYTVLIYDYNPFHFFIRQLIFGLLSICLMWGLSQLNPDKFLTFIGFSMFFLMFISMVALPFLPSSLAVKVNGATRWIRLGGFNFAPVEFFKIGFIYFLAWSFTRRIDGSKKSFISEFLILLPYIVLFVIVILFIAVLQNDLGQVVVLGLVLLMMVLFAGTSFKLLGTGLMLIIVTAVLAIISSDHRIRRIQSWWGGIQDVVLSFLPPEAAQNLRIEGTEAPYQISHSLNAINNGGLFGEGLGLGTFKLGFLSEVHTDFVLAGIEEEIGFFGIVIIIALIYFMIYRIFKVSSRSQNKVHYLFCLGIGFMLFFSFMINSYGITSITPVKGIAVPFLSYGGSQIIAASIGIGLVLMISKRSNI